MGREGKNARWGRKVKGRDGTIGGGLEEGYIWEGMENVEGEREKGKEVTIPE